MCGLAGFARHPDGPHLSRVTAAFEFMLKEMRMRGTHATGVAILDTTTDVRTWKRAAPSDKVLASEVYDVHVRQTIDADTRAVIGHTRWATLPNQDQDAAAHPFTIDRITGAHNGVIRNWKSVEVQLRKEQQKSRAVDLGLPWIVDSQAAIAVLATRKDPEKALRLLDGNYALTWFKGHSLHLLRHANPLIAAYVPSLRTLFWCSTRSALVDGLRHAGIMEHGDLWDLREDTLYRYDMRRFDAETTHGEKRELDIKFRHAATKATASYGGNWDGYDARETEPRKGPWLPKPKSTNAGPGLVHAQTELLPARSNGRSDAGQLTLDNLYKILKHQQQTIDELARRVQALEKDQELRDAPTCSVCHGVATDDRPLVEVGFDEHVHEGCIFATA